MKKEKTLIGSFLVDNPKLWWPYLSKNEDKYAYLYTLEVYLCQISKFHNLHYSNFYKVQLIDGNGNKLEDAYQLKIGIRSLSWDQSMQNTILINGKPLYIRGFGRHEDADVMQNIKLANKNKAI